MTAKRWLSILAFPVTLSVTHGVALLALGSGASPLAVLVPLALASIAVVAVLERVIPYDPDWNRPRGDLATDAWHNVLSTLTTAELVRIAMVAGLAPLAATLARVAGAPLWPVAWPLWAQALFAFVIVELAGYWVHRWAHEVDLLWRLHATHHSPERLYWLNAGRDHPLGVVLLHAPALLPLIVLGANAETFTMFSLFTTVVGLFQHANIDLRIGPLNYIFSVIEVHAWHHSSIVREANHNYGSNLMIWDVAFGTAWWPRDRRAPAAIGLADLPSFPAHYRAQMSVPFVWNRLRLDSSAQTAAVDGGEDAAPLDARIGGPVSSR